MYLLGPDGGLATLASPGHHRLCKKRVNKKKLQKKKKKKKKKEKSGYTRNSYHLFYYFIMVNYYLDIYSVFYITTSTF